MKNITINVPDMQSTHCQVRVSNAVKTIEGIQVSSQEPGKISVALETDKQEAEVIAAIEKAGYSVALDDGSLACKTGCCND